MYYYLYDTHLADKKFERVLATIESRLTDLGISGKIGRLTPFTNARGLIRDEVRRGVQTIVVVGNDETVSKVVAGLEDAKITIGLIPVGSPTSIAKALGIPDGIEACDILSKRVTQKLDLGMVNGQLFLSQVKMPGARVTLESEGKFRVTSMIENCDVVVSNLRLKDDGTAADGSHSPIGYAVGDPMDGWLDAMITPNTQGFFNRFRSTVDSASTVIPLRRLLLTSEEPISIEADGRTFQNDTVAIEIVPDRLKVITGKERAFA